MNHATPYGCSGRTGTAKVKETSPEPTLYPIDGGSPEAENKSERAFTPLSCCTFTRLPARSAVRQSTAGKRSGSASPSKIMRHSTAISSGGDEGGAGSVENDVEGVNVAGPHGGGESGEGM